MNILINATTLHTGGGKVVGLGFVEGFAKVLDAKDFIVVLCPKGHGYVNHQSNQIQCIEIGGIGRWMYKFFMGFFVRYFAKKYQAKALLNLCNIPIPINIPQYVLMHNSYFVYPQSSAWHLLRKFPKLVMKRRVNLFRAGIKYVKVFFVQTENIQNKLQEVYGIALSKITQVPTAVDFSHFANQLENKKNIEKKPIKKFLYLTRYYEHKNIEILVEVAKLIKKKSLPYQLIITVSLTDHKNVYKMLSEIKQCGLDNVILNIGYVEYSKIPEIYAEVDAIISPTLLESLGVTYLEAMYFEKPIFTSNLDFAKSVCKESGIYFDMHNPEDILEKMQKIEDRQYIINKITQGRNQLSTYPNDWKISSNIIYQTIKQNYINEKN